MNKKSVLYQLDFIVPKKAIGIFEQALDMYSSAVSMNLIEEGANKNKWQITAIFETLPNKSTLSTAIALAAMTANVDEPKWTLIPVANKNWLKESLANFPPLDLGRFYVYGSHIENPNIPDGKIALKIDAATAFGSGKHATTQGCLQAFEDVLKTQKIKNILDMGCGSGILAMAGAKILPNVKIDAVDIDPESVKVCKENIRENKVAGSIKVFQSNGYEKITKTYDLIFANILALPLIEMSADLYKHLNKGGVAILSGFLTHQKSWVVKAHKAQGLSFVKAYKIKEWGTVIVKKD